MFINKIKSLPPNVVHIVQDKGTERAFSGIYTDNTQLGTYLCRQCGIALFRAANQFHSSCGWPSFDAEIENNVVHQPDGLRTEIVCKRCGAHLGHVFAGENFTKNNIRYCVNSLSVDFVTDVN